MMRAWLFTLFFIGLSLASQSQTKHDILLMTGEVIQGNVTGTDSLYVYYDQVKHGGATKPRKLDAERVFSINGVGGEETMVYYMDTAIGNYFTVNEMRFYIQGEQDAMEYYLANWTVLTGLPVTAGLGYVLSGTVFAFALPFAYLVGTGVPRYKIPKSKISSPHLITEPAYVLGFERTARNKRLFKSLVTGLVGTAIGFTLGQTSPINR